MEHAAKSWKKVKSRSRRRARETRSQVDRRQQKVAIKSPCTAGNISRTTSFYSVHLTLYSQIQHLSTFSATLSIQVSLTKTIHEPILFARLHLLFFRSRVATQASTLTCLFSLGHAEERVE